MPPPKFLKAEGEAGYGNSVIELFICSKTQAKSVAGHALELELELILPYMAQKPVLRGEVGVRV